MYAPAHARATDTAWMREEVARLSFGVLFSAAGGAPMATHLPMIWDGEELVGHIARANPHWQHWVGEGSPAIAVFQGPNAYVSPGFYPSKAEHGRVLPTWNYVAVHVEGTAIAVSEPAALLRLVALQTDLMERDRPVPWKVSDAPDAFVEGQLKGIVGVRLRVHALSGTRKLSGNRSPADRAGVIAGLAAGDAGARAVAALMRERN